MKADCVKNKGTKTKLVFTVCMMLGLIALIIFVLSVIYEERFPYGMPAESLFFSILMFLIAIESFIFEKPLLPYLGTAWIWILAILLVRFSGIIDIALSPFIFWESIILLLVIGVLFGVSVKNKRQTE